MARCGCGGAAGTPCNCAIMAGAGITVNGDGSGGNPYQIAADPGAEPTVAVADTPSVDMSLGVVGKQYTVSGDVKVSADAGNALSQRASGLYVATGDGGPAPAYPGTLVKQDATQSIPNAAFTRVRFDSISGSTPPGIVLSDGGQTVTFDVGHWMTFAFVRFSDVFTSNNMVMFWALPGDSNTRLSGNAVGSFDPGAPQPGLHLGALLTPIVGLQAFALYIYQNSGSSRATQVVSAATHFTAKKLPV